MFLKEDTYEEKIHEDKILMNKIPEEKKMIYGSKIPENCLKLDKISAEVIQNTSRSNSRRTIRKNILNQLTQCTTRKELWQT